MSETIRSIELALIVDTNKRTEAYNAQVATLDEAREKLREWSEEWA